MNELEVFGWPAQTIDATWILAVGPAYIVTARCSDGCHFMRELIAEEELDRIRAPDALWTTYERHIRDAFARVHP